MSFTNERQIKATRKPHTCCGCRGPITPGSPAVRWSGMVDGDFNSGTYHMDCREAEVFLNPDFSGEWIGLADFDSEDKPLLLSNFPIVAARLGIVASSTEKADVLLELATPKISPAEAGKAAADRIFAAAQRSARQRRKIPHAEQNRDPK